MYGPGFAGYPFGSSLALATRPTRRKVPKTALPQHEVGASLPIGASCWTTQEVGALLGILPLHSLEDGRFGDSLGRFHSSSTQAPLSTLRLNSELSQVKCYKLLLFSVGLVC
jgi:hypothetical protein